MKIKMQPRAFLLPALSLATALWVGAGAFADDGTELRLPPDVTYRSAAGSPGPVVFRHSTHVAFTDRHCPACHPSLFSILGPTGALTHEEMNAGKQCGACHDGSKASGVQEACDHCHGSGGGR
jgi:c(7)-type cytochrome triheme protein